MKSAKHIYIVKYLRQEENFDCSHGVLPHFYADKADAMSAMLDEMNAQKREWEQDIPSDVSAEATGMECYVEQGTTGESVMWTVVEMTAAPNGNDKKGGQ